MSDLIQWVTTWPDRILANIQSTEPEAWAAVAAVGVLFYVIRPRR